MFEGHHHTFEPSEWLVKFRNPFGDFGGLNWEPTFVSNEMEFYMLAILTYIHAHRHGSRYLWLWWTTIAHGLMTECVSYWAEPIDNFWHAQSMFMWFGQREPLSIMCLYPGYVYTAAVAVSRLGVTERVEACAMGLFVVIFDMPYDILSDDALFEMALIYEELIEDKEKAQQYYQHLLTDYPGSIFVAEARKRFRNLRGDFVTQ